MSVVSKKPPQMSVVSLILGDLSVISVNPIQAVLIDKIIHFLEHSNNTMQSIVKCFSMISFLRLFFLASSGLSFDHRFLVNIDDCTRKTSWRQ